MVVVKIFFYVAYVALLGHYGTMVVVLVPCEPTRSDGMDSIMVAISFHSIPFSIPQCTPIHNYCG